MNHGPLGEPIDVTVREAMAVVDRRGFLPASQRKYAAADRALPIGRGKTNSQPSTVAFMLTLLDVRRGHRVLDIGAGSGWTTAILGHLVGATGVVIGVERDPAILEFGRSNLADHPDLPVRMERSRPGVLGRPDEGPYDRILVSAMADAFPAQLSEQLVDGGVLVVPVADVMVRAVKRGTEFTRSTHGRFAFVPLVLD